MIKIQKGAKLSFKNISKIQNIKFCQDFIEKMKKTNSTR